TKRVVRALDDDADRIAQILLGRRGREEPFDLFHGSRVHLDVEPRTDADGALGDALEIREVHRRDHALAVYRLESVGREEVREQTLLDAVRDIGYVLHASHRVGDRRDRYDRANVPAEDLLQPTDAVGVVGSTRPHQSTENRVEVVIEIFRRLADFLPLAVE